MVELTPEDIIDDFGESEIASPYLVEPDEERVKEVNDERAMVTGAAHMMAEIQTWFEKELTWAESINGLDPESKVSLDAQLLAKQRYSKFITEAIGRLGSLKSEHLDD